MKIFTAIVGITVKRTAARTMESRFVLATTELSLKDDGVKINNGGFMC
jgi:hypothetical protein